MRWILKILIDSKTFLSILPKSLLPENYKKLENGFHPPGTINKDS
jgi:hypothetical protein